MPAAERLRRWWAGLEAGGWVLDTRVPRGGWIYVALPFLLLGLVLTGFGELRAGFVVAAIGVIIFVVTATVVARNVDRAYADPKYGARLLRAEVVFGLSMAFIFVALALLLLVVVIADAVG